MEFIETKLKGAYIITPSLLNDERGFFTRVYCNKELAEQGLAEVGVQCNLSYNVKAGTLRGMHYQEPPYQEDKLVRCTIGSIYDVIIDLREDSPTYCRYIGVNLSSKNRQSLYVPKGFAHGYFTLEDHTEVYYQVSQYYTKGAEQGIMWNDSAFGIRWPYDPKVISDRDKQHPKFVR
jgi:dTDP-4-dehydrorhamnose 3,5-epimerase